MARTTKQCHTCKEQFLKSDLVDYASPHATVAYSYCPKCLAEKKARDVFSATVCNIFGLKAPGPRIWTERKRIIDTYGYSDQTIIDCLKYLYEIKGMKKLSESLCLITPVNIEKMLKYKKRQDFEATKISSAFVESMNSTVQPRRIRVKENTSTLLKDDWNPDDFFKD